MRVYPRVGGETGRSQIAQQDIQGLSPRVRGNLIVTSPAQRLDGSIPARAGEPDSLSASTRSHKVYPRACGGTMLIIGVSVGSMGLSPRGRGNPGANPRRSHAGGSIPARAGKPRSTVRPDSGRRVYPRACGETLRKHKPKSNAWGLSPRVRGNPPKASNKNKPLEGLSPRVRGNLFICP